ncbi:MULTISPECIES: 6-carboxytetrahydropterin synthase [Frankia]|nr:MULTISPECIES: 6-carboxytetrahydropterin synthase [Frankia]
MPAFEISKTFEFSASHRLSGLPADHKCARLHGHNYTVRVQLRGETLDPVGFLLDYGELSPVRDWIDAALDHQHLNACLDFNPTAELLAQHLAGTVRQLVPIPDGVRVAVGVSETPRTWAFYREAEAAQ